MTQFWDKQIQRADHLAKQSSGSSELLAFYAQLLRAQKEIYEFQRSREDWLPSGDLERDVSAIHHSLASFLKTVETYGPASLAAEAHNLSEITAEAIDEMLLNYWRNPSDIQFFAKAILQPYTRWVVESGAAPLGRELGGGERSCPRCGGKAQLSILQTKESNAESGTRELLCATCLSSWEFRRVVCANCGEERPSKLGYFHSSEFDHVRIEACDSCKHYIKAVDLTRLGFAAQLVDEVYAAPLDLWAREHGYTKIEINLVGV